MDLVCGHLYGINTHACCVHWCTQNKYVLVFVCSLYLFIYIYIYIYICIYIYTHTYSVHIYIYIYTYSSQAPFAVGPPPPPPSSQAFTPGLPPNRSISNSNNNIIGYAHRRTDRLSSA